MRYGSVRPKDYFGRPYYTKRGKECYPIQFWVTRDQKRAIKIACDDLGISISEFFRRLVRNLPTDGISK